MITIYMSQSSIGHIPGYYIINTFANKQSEVQAIKIEQTKSKLFCSTIYSFYVYIR